MKSLLTALQEGRLIELPENDKNKALQYLASIIEAVPDIGANLDLGAAVLQRETEGNTGIGMGVACPHVRAGAEGDLLCAVGWSPKGIDYGSGDGKKVFLVVMYYIPDSQKNSYLKEISGLARSIRREGGIKEIETAKDLQTVREELLNWVSAVIEAAMPDVKARMIRLEARQALAEKVPAIKGLVQAAAFLVLKLDGGKHVVLAQNKELAAVLERDAEVPALLKSGNDFDRAGFKILVRSSSAYQNDRIMYDCLAVKLR